MTKISGDNQEASVGALFFNALAIEPVNASGPAAYIVVHFASTGPVTLGPNAADTDANGVASLTVMAGTSTGTATVTAVAGALTQTFTLTVQ
jgi:hypothetical protein